MSWDFWVETTEDLIMTTHEYAKLLLEGEDLPLVVYIEQEEISKPVTSLPNKVYHEKRKTILETVYEEEIIPFGMVKENMTPVLEISV